MSAQISSNDQQVGCARTVLIVGVYLGLLSMLLSSDSPIANFVGSFMAMFGFSAISGFGIYRFIVVGQEYSALQLQKEKAAKELAELRNSPVAVMTEEEDGTQSWWQSGVGHRVDGPAVVRPDGTQRWLRHGKLHRTDGPALIDADGAECWYIDDKLHRVDGPARTNSDGVKFWYLNGKISRYDGPAIEFPDGTVQYWIDGRELSKAEHDLAKKAIDNG
jgi:hypothetical protein